MNRIKFNKGLEYEQNKAEDKRKTSLEKADDGKVIFRNAKPTISEGEKILFPDGFKREEYIDFNSPKVNDIDDTHVLHDQIDTEYNEEIKNIENKYSKINSDKETEKTEDNLMTIEDIYRVRPGLKELHDKVFGNDKNPEKRNKAIENELADYNNKAQLIIDYLDGKITARQVMEANLGGKYVDSEAKQYAEDLATELHFVYDRVKGNNIEQGKDLEKKKNIEKKDKIGSMEARIKLDKIREVYSKELKNCLAEMDKQKSIDKVRTSTFNILAGVKNIFSREKMNKATNKDYKEEDFYTEQYKKLEQEYKQAKIDLKDALVREKTEELEKAGFKDEKLKLALTRFHATDVFKEVIYDERKKIIDQRASANKNILTKTWSTYKEMPRYKKVLIGTLIFIPLTTAGGVGAVLGAKGLLGMASFAGLKFGAGMGVGYITSMASAGAFDLMYKNKNIEFYNKIKEENEKINDQFIKGEIFEDEYKEAKDLLEIKKNKYLKNQMIVKTATSIGFGMVAGLLAGGMMNNSTEHVEKFISNAGDNSVDAISGSSVDSGISEIGDVVNNTIEQTSVEVVAHNGQGVISTFHELQSNLRAEYTNIDNAPESVKHILSSSDTELAKEYGVYRPGEEAESAKIFVGDKLIFNKDTGEIIFKHIRGGEHVLQKGVKYLGEMFDSSRTL